MLLLIYGGARRDNLVYVGVYCLGLNKGVVSWYSQFFLRLTEFF